MIPEHAAQAVAASYLDMADGKPDKALLLMAAEIIDLTKGGLYRRGSLDLMLGRVPPAPAKPAPEIIPLPEDEPESPL